jgi:hypothetical protein
MPTSIWPLTTNTAGRLPLCWPQRRDVIWSSRTSQNAGQNSNSLTAYEQCVACGLCLGLWTRPTLSALLTVLCFPRAGVRVRVVQENKTVYEVLDKTASDQVQSKQRIDAAVKKGLEAKKADADKRAALKEADKGDDNKDPAGPPGK